MQYDHPRIGTAERVDLLDLGCCIEIDRPNDHLLESQQRTLHSLQRGIQSLAPRERFLRNYDSIMRVVESWLIPQSLMFGTSPHKALRMILLAHVNDSSRFDVSNIIALRHRIKKSGEIPSEEQVATVTQLYSEVLRRFG